jgi:hypothetical protein
VAFGSFKFAESGELDLRLHYRTLGGPRGRIYCAHVLIQFVTFASIKGERLDADASRHGAKHLAPFQVDHRQAAGIVIGDQQDATVRMKRHVHRSPAELQELLGLQLGIEDRGQQRVVARDDQVLAVRAVARDLSSLLVSVQLQVRVTLRTRCWPSAG